MFEMLVEEKQCPSLAGAEGLGVGVLLASEKICLTRLWKDSGRRHHVE
jgi:hypothetical protein